MESMLGSPVQARKGGTSAAGCDKQQVAARSPASVCACSVDFSVTCASDSDDGYTTLVIYTCTARLAGCKEHSATCLPIWHCWL